MYQHCASCIPLSHANRPNVLQKREIITIYQPNTCIEITAQDRNVSSLHASINQKVQHIIHLFHCAIRIPSRWKVSTENSEPPGNQREMQAADPFPICMEGHMCNLCGEFGRNANSNTWMIGTTALQIFDNDMHTMFNLISIIRCKWGRFVITIPCCRLSAIRKTTIVQSLLHVCNEILHCFLHHCRHIAGIIPIDSQVVLHKSDGHQLAVVTDDDLEQLVVDNDIFGWNVCQLDQKLFQFVGNFGLGLHAATVFCHPQFVCCTCGCFFCDRINFMASAGVLN